MAASEPEAVARPAIPRRAALTWTLVAAVLAALASPPALFPGAAFLVLVALGIFYEVLARTASPGRCAMLYFAVTYGVYAWSLGRVAIAGWFLIVFFGTLYGLLFARILGPVKRRAPQLLPLAFALAWCVIEALRAHWPGAAWQHAQVAQFFYEAPMLLWPARLIGEAGCNLLAAAFAVAVWSLVRERRSTRAGLALVAVVALAYAVSLGSFRELPAEGATLRVALVQTGVPAYRDQDDGRALRVAENLYAHYEKLAAEVPDCDLAVWPEGSLPGVFFPDGAGERRLVQGLERLFGGARAIVVGALRIDPAVEKDDRDWPMWYRNVAYLLQRKASSVEILGVHEKRVLVPGGETLPFWLAWARRFAPYVWRAEAGKVTELPRLEDGRGVGLPICYENTFPSRFVDDVARGATFFAVPSFEGWYRQGAELDQMVAMTVLRALETGREIVRSTNDGVSCRVTPDGRVVDAIERGGAAVRLVEVQPRRGSTPALAWGLRVPWIAAFGLGVLLLAVRSGRFRTPPAGARDRDA